MIADSKFACFLDTEGQKSYNTHMMDKSRGQPTMEGFAETYDSSGQRRSDVYKSYAGRSRGKYGSIKANMSPDEITPLIVAMRRDSPMQGYDFQYIIQFSNTIKHDFNSCSENKTLPFIIYLHIYVVNHS